MRDLRSGPSGRVRLRLGAVALFLAGPFLVFGWFQLFAWESSTVSDDGAYAVHASQLQDDGWTIPHLLSEADPMGEFFAYKKFVVTDRGFFLAPRHVVWTAMEAELQRVFGVVGLRVLPVLGLAACTLGAFCLARTLDHPRVAFAAGALVVASPILYHSLQLWAHAVVAAAFTAGVIGAARLLSHGFRLGPSLLAVGGCVVASALRGDGFVFALALALALAFVLWRRMRCGTSSALGLVAMPALLAASAALSHRASAFAARSVTGTSLGDVSPAPSGEFSSVERLGALAATLYSSPRSESLAFGLLVVATGLVGAFVYTLRVRAQPTLAALFLLGAALILVVRLTTEPAQPASGLIGAWPMVLLVLLRPWRDHGEGEKMVIIMVGAGIAGVALTQYEQAGGFSWGGRFLSPAVPALAVLIAASFSKASTAVANQLRLAPRVALLAICAVIPMLYFDASARIRYESHFELLAGVETGVYATSYDHIARADWGRYPERRWLRIPAGVSGIEGLVSRLRDSRIYEFIAYGLSEEQAMWLMDRPLLHHYIDEFGMVWPPVLVNLDPDGGVSARIHRSWRCTEVSDCPSGLEPQGRLNGEPS